MARRMNRTQIERIKAHPRSFIDPARMADVTAEAAHAGMTLSAYLDKRIDRDNEWGRSDSKDDAFTIIMKNAGVVWRSNPGADLYADTLGDVLDNPSTRALIPEWGRRVWAKTLAGGYSPQVNNSRFMILEDDEALGSGWRPILTSAAEMRREMEPLFSLAELVAFTNAIEGDAYRRIFFEGADVDQIRMHRIGEAADIPRAKVSTSEKFVRIAKYGKALELSYEALRNSPVDKIGLFIAQMALQAEEDRITHALDVLINGDGTANTAAEVIPLTDLEAGATELTYGVWLGFKAAFRRPYTMTHVFARTAEGVALQMLTHPNTTTIFQGSQFSQAIGAGTVQRINDIYGGVVRLGETDQVPADSYLGIDSRYALERITQTGSDVQESVRFIERQTQLLTFTEVEGFAVLDTEAAKLLDVAP